MRRSKALPTSASFDRDRPDTVCSQRLRRDVLRWIAGGALLAGAGSASIMSGAAVAPDALAALTEGQRESLRSSVVEMAALIRDGGVTAAEIAAAVVAAADATASWNIFISRDPAALLAAAERVTLPEPAQPLAGIPVVLKDNVNTIGLPTTGGTPALRANRPGANAPIVERLLAAGALIAGKANMHELSSGGTSNNGAFGAVANPWNPECVPGGSSGGSAAAVAAGIVPAAIGTDTAGSVRVPAALCGVVGFRPSVGRYPADGIVPLSRSFDTAGPIARSVADIVLLDAVLAGADEQALPPAPGPLRLGVANKLADAASSDVQEVFERALRRLSGAGIELIEIDLSEILELGKAAAIIDFEFPDLFRDYLAEYAPGITAEEVAEQIASPSVRQITQTRLTAEPDQAEYERITQQVLPELRAKHLELHREYGLNALVFPTTPRVALARGEDDYVLVDGEPEFSWFYFQNTAIASIAGNPSLSIPAGVGSTRLPVGLSLDALPNGDRELLAVGVTVETALAA